MNCFVHDRSAAVGVCSMCQKALCRDCVGRDVPRLFCRACLQQRAMFGFDYRSSAMLGPWPLIHVCAGVNPETMRPRVAKGVIAIGNVAIGGIAIAGLALGVISVGGLSIGVLAALGGAALGLGLSVGGVAVGSVALGGAALGFIYAVGGAAFGPAIVDGRQCDQAALEFIRRWLGETFLPPACSGL
jgi:hypothetical protein